MKSAIAQLQANNPVTTLSAISLRQLPERFLEGRSGLYGRQFNGGQQRGIAATKLIEQEVTEITENLCSLR